MKQIEEVMDLDQQEAEQLVSIPISQYTEWMLKAHTLSEIKKMYDKVNDEETFYYAVGALLE